MATRQRIRDQSERFLCSRSRAHSSELGLAGVRSGTTEGVSDDSPEVREESLKAVQLGFGELVAFSAMSLVA